MLPMSALVWREGIATINEHGTGNAGAKAFRNNYLAVYSLQMRECLQACAPIRFPAAACQVPRPLPRQSAGVCAAAIRSRRSADRTAPLPPPSNACRSQLVTGCRVRMCTPSTSTTATHLRRLASCLLPALARPCCLAPLWAHSQTKRECRMRLAAPVQLMPTYVHLSSAPSQRDHCMQLARLLSKPALPCPHSGRKKAALGYVVTYSLSCVTKHSPNYWVLMVGRVLGGIATSLLYSAFESWLVAEHFKRGYSGEQLGRMAAVLAVHTVGLCTAAWIGAYRLAPRSACRASPRPDVFVGCVPGQRPHGHRRGLPGGLLGGEAQPGTVGARDEGGFNRPVHGPLWLAAPTGPG